MDELEDYDAYMFALILSVNRLYDIALLLYSNLVSQEEAQFIRDLHSEGKLWAPPPFKFEDNDES